MQNGSPPKWRPAAARWRAIARAGPPPRSGGADQALHRIPAQAHRVRGDLVTEAEGDTRSLRAVVRGHLGDARVALGDGAARIEHATTDDGDLETGGRTLAPQGAARLVQAQ